MQLQRPLITSFQAFLLTSAASLTLFLAAVSINSVSPPMAWKKIRPTASMAPHDAIHRGPHEKTKGSLALQTAAIVGSSAAVEAAKAAGQGTAAIAVRRFLQW